jgi:hypothetical protein
MNSEYSPIFREEKQFEDEKYSIFEKKSQMTEYSSMLEILENYDGNIKITI